MISALTGNRLFSLFKHLLPVLLGLTLTSGYSAEIPDYYSGPGINPHRAYVSQDFGESIDPFTGKLQFHYTDLFLPGEAGFDLKIQRSYNSLEEELPPGTATSIIGMGWDMTFGLMVKPNNPAGCTNALLNTADNPVLSLADGSQEVFAAPSQGSSVFAGNTPNYISKNRWIAYCSDTSNGVEWTVYSPGGLKYELTKIITSSTHNIAALRKVTDTHGNTLTFDYFGDESLYSAYNVKPFVKRITGSDGRLVTFNYYDSTTAPYATMRLRSITANGQITTYNYRQVGTTNNYRLEQVDLPGNDSGMWKYHYLVDDTNLFTNVPGRFSIDRVEYPYGGAIEYTYTRNLFVQNDGKSSDAIKTKTTLNGTTIIGQWTYDYKPGYESYLPGELDKTTVTMPSGTVVYQHFGLQSAGADETWKIGLLSKVLTCDIGVICSETNAVQVEQYTWGSQTISTENFAGPRSRVDGELRQPILTDKVITRNGNVYTTALSNFDNYGNAQRVAETGNASRTSLYKYYRNNANWIVNRLEDETILDAATIDGALVDATIDRTFDNQGNLLAVNKYGVLTQFTYYSDGNVATTTNARGKTTTFKDYYRGTAQTEEQPEGVTLHRTINATGTLASQSDGKGFTTGFSYDALNRLATIDFPINSDVAISRTPNSKTLVRGNYQETISYDGFGRSVSKQSADTALGHALTSTTRYDALGRTVFESYPNSGEGTTYHYDVLNRIKQKTLNDGASVDHTYLGSNRLQIKDERGHATTQQFRTYGDPDKDQLVRTESPEDVITTIERDRLGNVTQIWQGDSLGTGSTRAFHHNSHFYVTQKSDPETGETYIGRDANGNMTSLQVGTGGPLRSYVYDDLDRLVSIDYPAPTPDVGYVYDLNSNITEVSNEASKRTAVYDENDNLTQEEVIIDETLYTIKYAYDTHDTLGAITYPTGRVVNYQPDALGRPTKAEPILDTVTYYPSGLPDTLVYHNGETTKYTLNNRRWIESIQGSGVSNSIGLSYGYDLSGNITGITNSLDGTYSRSMLYDGLNRLDYAEGSWGIEDYAYTANGDVKSIGFGGAESKLYNYVNNRLDNTEQNGSVENFAYDPYGNITGNDSYSFYYNDAQQLELATANGAGTDFVYKYDGNGMRVQRQKENQTSQYLYTADGQLLGEYATDMANAKEYFYLGGQRIAAATVAGNIKADAGANLTVYEGETFTLDGTGSSLFGRPIEGYCWEAFGKPHMSTGGVCKPKVTPTAPTGAKDRNYFIRLTVSNYKLGISDTDTVIVTVKIVDTDGDSLSDYWETEHYGGITAVGADDDTDGDGLTALQEFLDETDPTAQTTPVVEPQNAMRFTAMPADGEVRLTWWKAKSATGYDLYWSNSPGVTTANGTRIENVSSPFTHTGLNNGQPYHYILVAKNGCCEQSTAEVKATPGLSSWTTPTLLDFGYDIATGGYVDNEFKMAQLRSDPNSSIRYITVESYDPFNGWDEPGVLSVGTPTSAGSAPNIAMGHDESAIATWINGGTLTARHYDRANGWAEQYSWTMGTSGLKILSTFIGILDDGSATILFNARNSDSLDTVYFYAIDYTPQAGWSEAQLVTTVPNWSSLRQTLNVVMSRSGYLALFYPQYDSSNSIFPTSNWMIKRDLDKNWSEPIETIFYMGRASITEAGKVAGLGYTSSGPYSRRVLLWREDIVTGEPVTEAIDDGEFFDPSKHGTGDFGIRRVIYDDTGKVTIAWSSDWETEDMQPPPSECHLDPYFVGRIYYKQFVPGQGWTEQQKVDVQLPPGSYCLVAYPEFGLFRDALGDIHLLVNHGVADGYGSTRVQQRSLLDYRLKYDEGIRYPIDVYSWYVRDYPEFPHSIPVNTHPDLHGNAVATFAASEVVGNYVDFGSAFSQYVKIADSPNANAGVNVDVFPQATVALDAGNSSSPASTIASYAWRQLAGTAVALSDPASPSPTFSAPEVSFKERLWFELTVTDSNGLLDKDTVGVTVYPPTSNLTVNPGADEVVMEGATVTLDATGTEDPDGIIEKVYWIQASLPLVELQYATTNPSDDLQWVASFVAPEVEEDTVLTFKVRIHDTNGRRYHGYKQVTVRNNTGSTDVTPPTVTAPADLEVEATALLTAVDLGKGTATDDVDGDIEPQPNPAGPFALGAHVITWSATDNAGNQGTAVQNLLVVDTTPPVLAIPADVAVTSGVPVPVDIGQASATDIFGPVSIANDAPAEFPLGETLVTWTATDQNGNSAQGTQSVRVTAPDTTPPVVTAPPSINTEATAVDTPVDLGAASAIDDVDGAITPTPDQTGPFPLGLHTITWSATDNAGNRGTATQSVEVVDTTPPTLTVPPDVEVESDSPLAVDIGSASADDIFAPVVIENDAPSLFPLGTTIVKWTATDANGNVATAEQQIDVIEAASNPLEEFLTELWNFLKKLFGW